MDFYNACHIYFLTGFSIAIGVALLITCLVQGTRTLELRSSMEELKEELHETRLQAVRQECAIKQCIGEQNHESGN